MSDEKFDLEKILNSDEMKGMTPEQKLVKLGVPPTMFLPSFRHEPDILERVARFLTRLFSPR